MFHGKLITCRTFNFYCISRYFGIRALKALISATITFNWGNGFGWEKALLPLSGGTIIASRTGVAP